MKNKEFENYVTTMKEILNDFAKTTTEEKLVPQAKSLTTFCDLILAKFAEIPEKSTANCWLKIHDETSDTYYVRLCKNKEDAFFLACKYDIWYDCSNEHLEEIFADGKSYYCGGWMPDMVRVICDSETGEIVWEGQFENWDH